MSRRRSSKRTSSGFTLMILAGPGEQPRRVHVPRWALGLIACAWLVAMGMAAWIGFQSAEREPPRRVSPSIQGTMAAKAPAAAPASSPLSSRQ
jgi:hypothetical protein